MGRGGRAVVVVGLVAALSFGIASASGARKPSPQALYGALLTTAFPDSQLPSGVFSAKVSLSKPSKTAQKYHIVGEVYVAVDGADPDDVIEYYVFRNRRDAVAELNHPRSDSSVKLRFIPGRVPGYPRMPGHMWAGSVTGKNALGKTITDGVTLVAIVDANVLVSAVTDSADNTDSGDIPAALALLKSGLRHLHAVEAKIARKHRG